MSKYPSQVKFSRRTRSALIKEGQLDTRREIGPWSQESSGKEHTSHIQLNLSFFGELVNDICFKLGAVNAGLSKGSSIAILLPVMIPVPLLVCPITKHRHLNTDRKYCQDTL